MSDESVDPASCRASGIAVWMSMKRAGSDLVGSDMNVSIRQADVGS